MFVDAAAEEVVYALSADEGILLVGLGEADGGVVACAKVIEVEVVGFIPVCSSFDTDGQVAIFYPYAVDYSLGEIEASPLVGCNVGGAVTSKQADLVSFACPYRSGEAIVSARQVCNGLANASRSTGRLIV